MFKMNHLKGGQDDLLQNVGKEKVDNNFDIMSAKHVNSTSSFKCSVRT
jgi:hypothetical protein